VPGRVRTDGNVCKAFLLKLKKHCGQCSPGGGGGGGVAKKHIAELAHLTAAATGGGAVADEPAAADRGTEDGEAAEPAPEAVLVEDPFAVSDGEDDASLS